MSEEILQLKNIKKEFPGVLALDSVNITVNAGEVHAIVGENGAGKSTLMNVLSGSYIPNEGHIIFKGKDIVFREPRDAQDAGIAMIHQELSLSPSLSIYENIFVGRLKKNRFGLTDRELMIRESAELMNELGVLDLDPRTEVRELSISQQQLIEIAKAVSLNSDILIMDEPTSSLTSNETVYLFQIINGLKKKGVSTIFISHRMDEVFNISDRVTIMRDGRYIDTLITSETDEKEIVSLMVGRSMDKQFHRPNEAYCNDDDPVMEVRNLSLDGVFRDINFTLHSGEILGLTGLVGAGRSELVQAIFGVDEHPEGEILIDGEPVVIRNVGEAVRLGIGLIPEGRKIQGIFKDMTVRENISIASLAGGRGLMIDQKREKGLVDEYIGKLRIKTPGPEQKIKFLSGGNQQKAILARWLANNPRILILDEPTHGIDVGAKAEIYELMDSLAKEGIGILLISSELPEILTMSDRIMVMSEGRVNGILCKGDATQESIMELAIPRKGAEK